MDKAGGKPSQYLGDTLKVGYGTQGFETFHVDIPEQLRGKVATLKFEVTDDTVYLDDVFFKSTNLKFGNPSNAGTDVTNDRRNYLLEKPQYSLSYDAQNLYKTPKWVSW